MSRKMEGGEPKGLTDALYLLDREQITVDRARTREEAVEVLREHFDDDTEDDGGGGRRQVGRRTGAEALQSTPGAPDQASQVEGQRNETPELTDDDGGNPYAATEPMDYDAMNNDDRRAELERRGLVSDGNKDELIDRLQRADAGELDDDDIEDEDEDFE